MSSTTIDFSANVIIGDQNIPIKTEIVTGDSDATDGISNGFLFTLDYQPGQDPVEINLGPMIQFIEDKLGTGSMTSNPGLTDVSAAIPSVTSANFTDSNDTIGIVIKEFTINSIADKKYFSINVDIQGASPTSGLIELPAGLNEWLKIDNLSISFYNSTEPTP